MTTLKTMRQLARRASMLPAIRIQAVEIVTGTGTNDETQAQTIRDWLDSHCAFLRDPSSAELLIDPPTLLALIQQQGYTDCDCDDVAMLGAALGMSVGLRAQFWAVGREHFEHVFTALGPPDGSRWWELDITRPSQQLPATFTRHFVIEV